MVKLTIYRIVFSSCSAGKKVSLEKSFTRIAAEGTVSLKAEKKEGGARTGRRWDKDLVDNDDGKSYTGM